jgi:hypothetical protein
VIVAPLGNRGRVLNRQGYARHSAGLDHRRCSPIHWAADTHGDKSAEETPRPGRPQRAVRARLFFQPSSHMCLCPAKPTHVSASSASSRRRISFVSQRRRPPTIGFVPILDLPEFRNSRNRRETAGLGTQTKELSAKLRRFSAGFATKNHTGQEARVIPAAPLRPDPGTTSRRARDVRRSAPGTSSDRIPPGTLPAPLPPCPRPLPRTPCAWPPAAHPAAA